ncbi:MAG: hypothetical protein WBB28_20690 [Crinalium sp.]
MTEPQTRVISITPISICYKNRATRSPNGYGNILGQGAILPSGRVAIMWLAEEGLGSHSSFFNFKHLERYIESRGNIEAVAGAQSHDSYTLNSFHLRSLDNTTILAEGVHLINKRCIVSWLHDPFTETWYSKIKEIEEAITETAKIVWDKTTDLKI